MGVVRQLLGLHGVLILLMIIEHHCWVGQVEYSAYNCDCINTCKKEPLNPHTTGLPTLMIHNFSFVKLPLNLVSYRHIFNVQEFTK